MQAKTFIKDLNCKACWWYSKTNQPDIKSDADMTKSQNDRPCFLRFPCKEIWVVKRAIPQVKYSTFDDSANQIVEGLAKKVKRVESQPAVYGEQLFIQNIHDELLLVFPSVHVDIPTRHNHWTVERRIFDDCQAKLFKLQLLHKIYFRPESRKFEFISIKMIPITRRFKTSISSIRSSKKTWR